MGRSSIWNVSYFLFILRIFRDGLVATLLPNSNQFVPIRKSQRANPKPFIDFENTHEEVAIRLHGAAPARSVASNEGTFMHTVVLSHHSANSFRLGPLVHRADVVVVLAFDFLDLVVLCHESFEDFFFAIGEVSHLQSFLDAFNEVAGLPNFFVDLSEHFLERRHFAVFLNDPNRH